MCYVVLLRVGIKKDIIKEINKISYVRPKEVIHQTLKSGRYISETKRCHEKLVVSLMGTEGSLRNVRFMDSNLVVSSSEVQFGEETSPIKFIQQFIYN